MRNPLTRNRADGRPRVHITVYPSQCMWSIGPTGRLTPAATPGQALDAALAQTGKQDVVAFVEMIR